MNYRVVLVGESLPTTRILGVALASAGYEVVLVDDPQALATTVMTPPDLIILDHVEPTDLYRLNPRVLGFGGRLLLLTEVDPDVATQVLTPDFVVRKPFDIEAVRRQVRELLLLLGST